MTISIMHGSLLARGDGMDAGGQGRGDNADVYGRRRIISCWGNCDSVRPPLTDRSLAGSGLHGTGGWAARARASIGHYARHVTYIDTRRESNSVLR